MKLKGGTSAHGVLLKDLADTADDVIRKALRLDSSVRQGTFCCNRAAYSASRLSFFCMQCDAELATPAAEHRRELTRSTVGTSFKRNFSVNVKSPQRLPGGDVGLVAASGSSSDLASGDAPQMSGVQRRRLMVEAQERVFRLEQDLNDARRHLGTLNKSTYDAQTAAAAAAAANDTVNI